MAPVALSLLHWLCRQHQLHIPLTLKRGRREQEEQMKKQQEQARQAGECRKQNCGCQATRTAAGTLAAMVFRFQMKRIPL